MSILSSNVYRSLCRWIFKFCTDVGSPFEQIEVAPSLRFLQHLLHEAELSSPYLAQCRRHDIGIFLLKDLYCRFTFAGNQKMGGNYICGEELRVCPYISCTA